MDKQEFIIYYYNFSFISINKKYKELYADTYDIKEIIIIHSEKLKCFYTKDKNI